MKKPLKLVKESIKDYKDPYSGDIIDYAYEKGADLTSDEFEDFIIHVIRTTKKDDAIDLIKHLFDSNMEMHARLGESDDYPNNLEAGFKIFSDWLESTGGI